MACEPVRSEGLALQHRMKARALSATLGERRSKYDGLRMANRVPRRASPIRPRRSHEVSSRIEAVVDAWTERYGITTAEARVVVLAASRAMTGRDELALALRLSPNTVKDHIRALLRRTALPSLAHVCLVVLHEVLGDDRSVWRK